MHLANLVKRVTERLGSLNLALRRDLSIEQQQGMQGEELSNHPDLNYSSNSNKKGKRQQFDDVFLSLLDGE